MKNGQRQHHDGDFLYFFVVFYVVFFWVNDVRLGRLEIAASHLRPNFFSTKSFETSPNRKENLSGEPGNQNGWFVCVCLFVWVVWVVGSFA